MTLSEILARMRPRRPGRIDETPQRRHPDGNPIDGLTRIEILAALHLKR